MGLPGNWLRAGDYRAWTNYQMQNCSALPVGLASTPAYDQGSTSAFCANLDSRIPPKHLGEKFSPHLQLISKRSASVYFPFFLCCPCTLEWKQEYVTFSSALWTSGSFEQMQRMPGKFLSANLLNLQQKIWPVVLVQQIQLSFCCCC